MVAARVDMAAIEREASKSNSREMARYLQDTLGQRVVAYVCGLKDPKMVGRWARGTVKPSPLAALRLRQTYEAVRLLADAYGPEMASSWLFGPNTRLDDEAPAYVLRYARDFDAMRRVVPIARAFVVDDVGNAGSSALRYPTVASLRERGAVPGPDLSYREMREIAYEDRLAPEHS